MIIIQTAFVKGGVDCRIPKHLLRSHKNKLGKETWEQLRTKVEEILRDLKLGT